MHIWPLTFLFRFSGVFPWCLCLCLDDGPFWELSVVPFSLEFSYQREAIGKYSPSFLLFFRRQ